MSKINSNTLFILLFFYHIVILNSQNDSLLFKQRNIGRQRHNTYFKGNRMVGLEVGSEYPKGDKKKLREISNLWLDYYTCCTRLRSSLNSFGQLPSVVIAAFLSSVVRLRCNLCIPPNERNQISWYFSKNIDTSMSLITYELQIVQETNGNLTIYGVKKEDSGVYQCRLGKSAGGIVILEIANEDNYNVVKPCTSRGPFPASEQSIWMYDVTLKLFTSWTHWSECSDCGKVGRKRRFGLCYLTAIKDENLESTSLLSKFTKRDTPSLRKVLLITKIFPEGIPCHSKLLPQDIRQLSSIRHRRNEIMIGLCKVKCERPVISRTYSTNGIVLEQSNISDDVISLWQENSNERLVLASTTIFVPVGEKLKLRCSGAALWDIPFNWRVGTKYMVPRDIDRSTNGRIHLDAIDQIVFSYVKYSDANVYSCWQRDVLIGTIKLEVWKGEKLWWNFHLVLFMMLILAIFILRWTDKVLREKRQRFGRI